MQDMQLSNNTAAADTVVAAADTVVALSCRGIKQYVYGNRRNITVHVRALQHHMHHYTICNKRQREVVVFDMGGHRGPGTSDDTSNLKSSQVKDHNESCKQIMYAKLLGAQLVHLL